MSTAEVRAAGGARLAREMLEQFDAVLLLEEAGRWPPLLAASLNWTRGLAIPHLRASGGSAAADDGIGALLAEHNQMDEELYDYARRIERVDVEFHLGPAARGARSSVHVGDKSRGKVKGQCLK